MQSAAFIEAAGQGLEVYPILDVTWLARGYTPAPRGVYSPSVRTTDIGGVTQVTRLGGWDPIEYGSGIAKGNMETVSTGVSISDPDRELIDMLETYDPRGSLANINWASPALVEADWEPVFRGVVEDWERDGLFTKLLLKTDDTVLRTLVPAPVFSRVEWPATFDNTIFGTAMPMIFGIHDAFLLTARGMVPGINIRYDKDLGYWWIASLGNLVDIRRVYYDGKVVADAVWSVRRGTFGGSRMTIIVIADGLQPEEGVVVSFDCEGPDSSGLSGGSAITGPVQQLRTILEEYVYRDPPLAGYRGDASIIDDTSWDATAAFFDARGYDCGRRFGGDQNSESAAEVIQSALDAYPFLRIWWTPLGKLAIGVIDPDDVDPDSSLWLDLELHHAGGQVPFVPGDRREVYTHLLQPYMWSSSEQKYMSAIEAHDVAALDEKVKLSIDNPWSQARFNQE